MILRIGAQLAEVARRTLAGVVSRKEATALHRVRPTLAVAAWKSQSVRWNSTEKITKQIASSSVSAADEEDAPEELDEDLEEEWELADEASVPIVNEAPVSAAKKKPALAAKPARRRTLQEIKESLESEIVEQFIRGSGPGGQKINKTSSTVLLQHKPTGIVVRCQETRSRDQNRKVARKILAERIDQLENGPESKKEKKREKLAKKKANKKKKAKRKLAKKDGEEDKEIDEAEEAEQGVEGIADTASKDDLESPAKPNLKILYK
ncbi:hypothetical protein SAICODRAFT_20269 [Saitoella complicata NRRL Y-17804]|uniref:uncharacterized protein n=1 Tax=Saitoella complicata (strain BCRC 22490 / CBS 7301 / JCM 7358 / NBRC 10748 / NRRL Y-17804) TaxID=698492 RepID=UPI000867A378|nr:uncharacterized protein SAICODRAFT_20269 [Saitoella complicata NRRL Y-17804]ODQ51952.1 hypothetical protein SAICODRAFT_20269 [Saitoella complicata NRRL Y-17804]